MAKRSLHKVSEILENKKQHLTDAEYVEVMDSLKAIHDILPKCACGREHFTNLDQIKKNVDKIDLSEYDSDPYKTLVSLAEKLNPNQNPLPSWKCSENLAYEISCFALKFFKENPDHAFSKSARVRIRLVLAATQLGDIIHEKWTDKMSSLLLES